MRTLLAIDGSASSDAARRLVGSLAWPEGSCIRVLAVVEPASGGFAGLPPYPIGEVPDADIAAALRASLDEAVTALEEPGRGVEARLVRGRAASTIVNEAEAFGAELIVVGSRGLGRFGSIVLGSVSAEVVDHAPCPVLVARGDAVGSALVAVDGSASSWLAVDHLGLGYLGERPMEIIAVGPAVSPTVTPITAGSVGTAAAASTTRDALEREHVEATAARAAEQLQRDGCHVRWSISAGDPAHEIIEAARNFGCDLIVMGSRGHTGLTRLLLGSVARNVLLHTHASVLIVRGPVRKRVAEPVTRRVALPAVAARTGCPG